MHWMGSHEPTGEPSVNEPRQETGQATTAASIAAPLDGLRL